MSDSLLRTDLLSEDLTVAPETIVVEAQRQFDAVLSTAIASNKTKTPKSSKDIIEVLELIRQAVLDKYSKDHKTEDAKIDVTYQEPDKMIDLETISMTFTNRVPGQFAQGPPQIKSGVVKNRRPILREVLDDEDNPGYKKAFLGYFFDNVIELTPWARTNKQANARALWLEELMEEYTWFFVYSGTNRVFFDSWGSNRTVNIDGNKFFGRPINYFVRTERILEIKQKTLEQILLRHATDRTI